MTAWAKILLFTTPKGWQRGPGHAFAPYHRHARRGSPGIGSTLSSTSFGGDFAVQDSSMRHLSKKNASNNCETTQNELQWEPFFEGSKKQRSISHYLSHQSSTDPMSNSSWGPKGGLPKVRHDLVRPLPSSLSSQRAYLHSIGIGSI